MALEGLMKLLGRRPEPVKPDPLRDEVRIKRDHLEARLRTIDERVDARRGGR